VWLEVFVWTWRGLGVVVKSLETGAGREVELVDRGSVFTWISRGVLEELGVRPRRVRRFRTVDGRVVAREVGVATIVYEGCEGDVEVVFAEKGDAEVLGVTALGTLGLEVEPSYREAEVRWTLSTLALSILFTKQVSSNKPTN
jgi:predicted aspartyl protease